MMRRLFKAFTAYALALLVATGSTLAPAQVPIYTKGPSFNPAAVAITGGTGVPIVLYSGGVPFIGLSSGSVAANGAISGITALPLAYPNAYCYFPANILATSGQGSTAGFYYCTFSTTTAGTAFLNGYTSGKATIPASPTAVTSGQGAFTGDLTEEVAINFTLPAMSGSSALRLMLGTMQTNNANVKALFVRISGAGGTVFVQQALTSQPSCGMLALIQNAGASAKQISYEIGAFGQNITTNGVLGTVDLSTGTATLVLSFARNTISTDNIVLLPPTIEMLAVA